jgi:ATP-dependent DNA helicase RecQ
VDIPNTSDLQESVLALLRTGVGNATAQFRDGQFEAIEHLVSRRGPLLVVQRTGWGKSNVYYIACKLLRNSGAGPALIVSPLLALMRNQIGAAERIGVRAERITSEEQNRSVWNKIRDELLAGKIDALLISPERLGNEKFLRETLYPIAEKIGLLVIDEAHCISDWGHDFRPNYRRITRILQALPQNVPVLATTASANNRVVADLKDQLGSALTIFRGVLARPSLCLQNIHMPGHIPRLSWLAQTIPQLPGSGLIYTLTVRDARMVSKWLRHNHIEAVPYWGGMEEELEKPGVREEIENRLLANQLKVVVATTALGMGFDKPDLGFVIHYQLPGSVIHYYQQVGRAGRSLEKAYGILLHGHEEREIVDHFIQTAFPPRSHIEQILDALEKSSHGMSLGELQNKLNIGFGALNKALKLLTLESPAPVVRDDTRWKATPARLNSQFWDRVERLTQLRRVEQAQMHEYAHSKDCLMLFQAWALDDPYAMPCGRCSNCVGRDLLPALCPPKLSASASLFLRRIHHPILPRNRWPKDAFPRYGLSGAVSEDLTFQPGRALSVWGDAGWGEMVRDGKYQREHFDDELVAAVERMIRDWNPQPAPQWIAAVPSLTHPLLVSSLAQRLAKRLKLPFRACVRKTVATAPQKQMQNSFQQAHNLDGVFEIDRALFLSGPVLLLDDMVDSTWTFTVVAALLRRAGAPAVFPVALAVTSKTDHD